MKNIHSGSENINSVFGSCIKCGKPGVIGICWECDTSGVSDDVKNRFDNII